MHEKVLIIDKKTGQTPLDCVTLAKNEHPQYKYEPMTYAGRLDPLASGLLLVLVGDECLKKDDYLALPKEYVVTVLLGFGTDTYDVMGKVTDIASLGKEISEEEIREALRHFTGRFHQAYPPYSSRTVDGKPLFQWARENKLGQITIPSHDVSVESIDITEMGSISGSDLEHQIQRMVLSVSGDFRQEEILQIWHATLGDIQERVFQTATLRIACGSGVYVRSIAHELGIALGMSGLALSIRRTRIGEYSLDD